MGSDWPISSLGETCYITDGAHAKVARQKSGIPYLTSKNLGRGNLKLDQVDFISESDFRRLFTDTTKSQRGLRSGDVLTGIIGTFGNAYRYKDEDHFGISSSIAILRPHKDLLDSDFLYYAITSEPFKNIVSAYKGGSVQGYTNIATLKVLPVPLPDLASQKQIAHVLGRLDAKITLNYQINTTLESMAQTLFKSWFVDFDPVIDNALAAGHPIPEALKARADARAALGDQRKPLPDPIRQQFPNRFVLTEEMGWVPEGWAISTIGDEVDTTGGGTPSTKESSFWEGGSHPFCTPKDMSQLGSLVLRDTERHLTDSGVAKISSGQLSKGTVLMSSRAPIGYLAISDIPVSINQGIIAMPPNLNYGPIYLLCWCLTNMKQITDRANGSTFQEISKKNFRPIPFLVPGKATLDYFNQQAGGIYSRILLTSEQIESLSKLRDTLLPKLLSGELRMPEAGRQVELAM